ncbi:cobalt ABC transporter, permease protein CbiQ [Desulfitobacterium dichloroeliminans LMG P-21439]|uniref:Cobalt ABC transporter, permease protein CbiQ n=1 Tax=Desulfitobacterium dichloroeliminans (strain LMG P-21439 / DCA1) TaxID=871963 RepID=L0F2S9_DESDL|nr:cobalt ECF transporter T component CbiQ [Desulfitobacterium dichloroeliminans]AGA68139.1 cobalt ABC transporter, permease protein CbiQ [Desulfitobacterium dichloroeliminans LMG P-21439]
MANMMDTVFDMRLLDDLSGKETLIHRVHPLAKLLTTLLFIVVVVSYDRYEIFGLLPLVFFPVLVMSLGELPLGPIMKRMLLAAPFALGIGVLNPFFDHQVFMVGGITLSRGWITFLSILIKSILTVSAALLLIATTGMDKLGSALRLLKIPKLFVLQLLLTYRYISVLLEEVSTIWRAYSLRSPQQKGINHKVWGPLIGQLLLRTYERAQRVYQSMCLRGFTGEYNTGEQQKPTGKDFIYALSWGAFFILAKMINIPLLIGNLFY